MKSIARRLVVLVAMAATSASSLEAQGNQIPRNGAFSANPFGLLLDIFNAEFERKVSQSTTAGVGGSMAKDSGQTYLNMDAFWRFYVSGSPLRGWAFGVKAGITSVTNSGTYPGLGFDVNRSWVLGPNQNFYVGLGFGLKRLYGTKAGEIEYLPTFRIVNVGFAF